METCGYFYNTVIAILDNSSRSHWEKMWYKTLTLWPKAKVMQMF